MARTTRILITFILGLMVPTGAGATTWYVGKIGSDSNSCAQAQNAGTPKLTIRAALACVGSTGAGHLVEVAGGTYDERISIMPSGTSWSAPFTLRAKPGDTVIVKPSTASTIAVLDITGTMTYAIIQGFIFDGTANDNRAPTVRWRANFIRLLNNELRNNNGMSAIFLESSTGSELIGGSIHDGAFIDTCCGGPGLGYPIYLATGNTLIEGVEFYNFPLYGIHVYNTTPGASLSGNIIRKNIIRNGGNSDPGSCGIIIGNTPISNSDSQIYDNIIHSMNSHAMCISGTNHKIYNNTVYGNRESGIYINHSSGIVVKNNIVAQNRSPILNEGNNTVMSNNLTSGDPLFVDPVKANFRLRSGSPAIDTGANLSSTVVDDFAGMSRPQGGAYDIGAFEYSSSISLPAPSSLIVMP